MSLALAGAGAGLYLLPPPNRPFSLSDPSISLKYREDTISEPLLFGLAAGVPLASFALAQLWLRSGHDFHHAALGLTEALSLTLLLTTLLKVTVGRLRPDFLDRCQPNDKAICQGEADVLLKGRKSFPSGHSSIAFAAGTFLSLYLWGKLRPFDGKGSFWKLPVLLLPVTGAALVAVSRITDHRHHWEDVLVGGLLGAGFAILAYHLNFPALWAKDPGRPLSRLKLTLAPILGPQGTGLALSGQF